jgi:hypothetical protein
VVYVIVFPHRDDVCSHHILDCNPGGMAVFFHDESILPDFLPQHKKVVIRMLPEKTSCHAGGAVYGVTIRGWRNSF